MFFCVLLLRLVHIALLIEKTDNHDEDEEEEEEKRKVQRSIIFSLMQTLKECEIEEEEEGESFIFNFTFCLS